MVIRMVPSSEMNQPIPRLISLGGSPGRSITPTYMVRPKAMIPMTAVISPRGHDSWWSRMTIQSRTIGAAAAASSSQRRIVWASKAETLSRTPFTFALRFCVLGLYQGRKAPSASSTPPAAARSSEMLMRRRSIGRATLLAVLASPRLEPRAHLAGPRAGDRRRPGRKGRRDSGGPAVGQRDHGQLARRPRDPRRHLAQARRATGPADAAGAAPPRRRAARGARNRARRGLRPVAVPRRARLPLVRAGLGFGVVRCPGAARAHLHACGGRAARGGRRGRGDPGPGAPRRARRPAEAR